MKRENIMTALIPSVTLFFFQRVCSLNCGRLIDGGSWQARLFAIVISLIQRKIVVSPKIWKMGLLLPFDIKDRIVPTNVTYVF